MIECMWQVAYADGVHERARAARAPAHRRPPARAAGRVRARAPARRAEGGRALALRGPEAGCRTADPLSAAIVCRNCAVSGSSPAGTCCRPAIFRAAPRRSCRPRDRCRRARVSLVGGVELDVGSLRDRPGECQPGGNHQRIVGVAGERVLLGEPGGHLRLVLVGPRHEENGGAPSLAQRSRCASSRFVEDALQLRMDRALAAIHHDHGVVLPARLVEDDLVVADERIPPMPSGRK